jgi:hypothetical protein
MDVRAAPPAFQLIVTFEPSSGSVQIQGPIDHPFLCAGALMEALRVIQARANKREAARKNGADLVVVSPDGLIKG